MTTDLSNDFFEYCPGLLFVADTRGNLLRQNIAFTEQFSAQLAKKATTLASLAASDDAETVQAFLLALANNDGPQACVLRIPDQRGGQLQMRCQARRAPNGSLHGMLEPAPPTADESLQIRLERKLLRALIDTLEVVLWATDPQGVFVFHDGKALATAGLTPNQFLGMNVFDLYPPEHVAPIQAAIDEGTTTTNKAEAHDVHWETWIVGVKGDAGTTEFCVGLTVDITATVETERELKRQLATIKDQQRAIQELSAPLIEVWDQVLTVPLVGIIDAEQTDQLIERLLSQVSQMGARFAILDLTGADVLDTATAGHILRLVDSLRLLGVEGMLTGISPIVAQTMVGLEVNFARITTRRTLRDGLRYCMRQQQERA